MLSCTPNTTLREQQNYSKRSVQSTEASRAGVTLFLFASSDRVGSTILTNALSPTRKHNIYWKLLSRLRETIISQGSLVLNKRHTFTPQIFQPVAGSNYFRLAGSCRAGAEQIPFRNPSSVNDTDEHEGKRMRISRAQPVNPPPPPGHQ